MEYLDLNGYIMAQMDISWSKKEYFELLGYTRILVYYPLVSFQRIKVYRVLKMDMKSRCKIPLT